MRIEMVNKSIKTGLKYLAPVLASGLIAFGSVSTVSADGRHGYRDGPRHYGNANYGHDRWQRGLKRGHFKRNKGHARVRIYHHYGGYPAKRARVVHNYYYEPEPVYIERRRVIEHRRYVEPAPAYHQGGYYGPSGSSLIGAAIGGLLGSQVGKGDGKLAATAAGAVTGYVVGGRH